MNLIFIITLIYIILHLKKIFFSNDWLKIDLNLNKKDQTPFIGIFHPFAYNGGGGERVLWEIINILNNNNEEEMTLLENIPACHLVIYIANIGPNDDIILNNILNKFNINININNNKLNNKIKSLTFIRIKSYFLLEPKYYPHFTMIGQSIGSIFVALECLWYCTPNIWIDTIGWSFTFPIAKFCMGRNKILPIWGGKTIGYIHYPTISSDMLNRVIEQKPQYNNNQLIAKSITLSKIKLIYYKIFAFLYSLVGKCADIIMVNSTWTKNHIQNIWGNNININLIYPPCDISSFKSKLNNNKRYPWILSIGQFRPEKDHQLQLDSFKLYKNYLNNNNIKNKNNIKLIICGSCRNQNDENIYNNLINYTKNNLNLNIKELLHNEKLDQENNLNNIDVIFMKNVSFDILLYHMIKSKVGLHTMWNEHFGIGIVEMMSAGLITIAHNSGGPKSDIIIPYNNNKNEYTGFLASTKEEYCEKMKLAFELNENETNELINRTLISIERFSCETFHKKFLESISNIF